MAITFERADTIDDATFDILFAASLDDIKSGTLSVPSEHTTDDEIKTWLREHFNFESHTRHGILVKKDNTPINWIVGNNNPSDTFVWNVVLNGTVNGSKSVFYTSEWHTNHKAYQQSIGVSKYRIPCIKDSRVDNYFTAAQSAGVMLGNYTRNVVMHKDIELGQIQHCWEY
jgi:hypothetical protein